MFEHDHHRHDAHAATPLSRAVWFTLGFAVVEAIAGWWSGSLALLADSGHMLSDSLGLVTAFAAARLAQRPADAEYTYGFGRVEVVAAALNALVMLGLVVAIAWGAFQRFSAPVEIKGLAVVVVAALGLGVNVAVFMTLRAGTQTINVRGAMLHVLGDLMGSVAALIAGLVVWLTGWTPIDPLLSLIVCGLLLNSATRLFRDALDVMLERVPRGMSVAAVGASMAAVRGVKGVHDLHIWTASSDTVALSAHVVVERLADWEQVLPAMKQHLHEAYGIGHVTLQPEPRATPSHDCGEQKHHGTAHGDARRHRHDEQAD
jgi:cobalt-zinc-cadmium efflux system protein